MEDLTAKLDDHECSISSILLLTLRQPAPPYVDLAKPSSQTRSGSIFAARFVRRGFYGMTKLRNERIAFNIGIPSVAKKVDTSPIAIGKSLSPSIFF